MVSKLAYRLRRHVRFPRLSLSILCAAAVLANSCSVFLAAEEKQCTTNADCAGLGDKFAGMYCSSSNVCVRNDTYCTSNVECLARKEHTICSRETDRRCVDLLSPECPTLYMTPGDLEDENVVVFGTLLYPTVSQMQSASDKVVNLAREEIQRTVGGLPAVGQSGKKRPVVFVSCNGRPQDPSLSKSADHLVNVLKVPAIIGPIASADVIKIANDYTLPAKVLMLTPGGSSVHVGRIQNRGQLIYRYDMTTETVTSGNAALLADYVEGLVKLRKHLSPGDKIKVGFLYGGDGLGLGTAELLVDRLRFNNASAADNGGWYVPRNYGDPTANEATFQANYTAAASFMAGQHPDVLIVDGSVGIDKVLPAIVREEDHDPQFKPFYILPAGAAALRDITKIITNEDLRMRVLGDKQAPSDSDPTYLWYQSYIRGSPPFTEGPLPGANVYDAAYMLHYAAAAVGRLPLTGENLGAAMQRIMPPGEPLRPGVLDMSRGFDVLGTGGRVDFQGFRGPEDFDSRGDTAIDLFFWCLPKGGNTQTETGLYFPATTRTLKGTNHCFDDK